MRPHYGEAVMRGANFTARAPLFGLLAARVAMASA
jgi:hypothetical protein